MKESVADLAKRLERFNRLRRAQADVTAALENLDAAERQLDEAKRELIEARKAL